MPIPKELQQYLGKILAYVVILSISFLALFFIRIALTASFTPIFGEENANKLAGAIFLTPSKIFFNQYGIGLYSFILIVVIAVFSENKGRKY